MPSNLKNRNNVAIIYSSSSRWKVKRLNATGESGRRVQFRLLSFFLFKSPRLRARCAVALSTVFKWEIVPHVSTSV